MPHNIIKDSLSYCIENKMFFCFMIAVLFLCQFIINLFDFVILGPIVTTVLMTGYGLLVTHDVIHGGTRLPKIKPKMVIEFGLKGLVILIFYVMIQSFILVIFAYLLNFPPFELEEMILNYSEIFHLVMVHDPASFIIFFLSGFIIVYVTTFFMELALARLADGGKLKNAFNFPRIKRAIDIIGWRAYAWDYTKIIVCIILLTHLIHYEIPFDVVDAVFDTILSFLMFAIEFIGIGEIYKVYKQKSLVLDVK